MRSIGGEFEIDLGMLRGIDLNFNSSLFLFSTGRMALKVILCHLKKTLAKNVIHLPYYICSSVVEVCITEGFELKFYEINSAFELSMEYLDNIQFNEVLLTVCYFGIVSDNDIIKKVKNNRPDIHCISDHVMSYWTLQSTYSDYSFTSLRKHFAIPEGGIIYSKRSLNFKEWTTKENSFYLDKYIAATFKFLNTSDSIFLHFFQNGERKLDEEITEITKASVLANHLYNNTNFIEFAEIRLANAKYVYDKGNEVGLDFIFSYDGKSIPQHIPIWVNDSQKLRKALFSENIFLPIHWPVHDYNLDSKTSLKMNANSISLVIDQRYNEDDMHRLVMTVSEFNNKLRKV